MGRDPFQKKSILFDLLRSNKSKQTEPQTILSVSRAEFMRFKLPARGNSINYATRNSFPDGISLCRSGKERDASLRITK